MRVLIHTDIVLDLLLDRAPHAAAAAELFTAIENGRLTACMAATTVTAVHHLLVRALGAERAAQETRKLLTLCEVAPVARPVLEAALGTAFPDFDDAVVCESARHGGAELVVTRKLRDFSNGKLTAFSAAELVRLLPE